MYSKGATAHPPLFHSFLLYDSGNGEVGKGGMGGSFVGAFFGSFVGSVVGTVVSLDASLLDKLGDILK